MTTRITLDGPTLCVASAYEHRLRCKGVPGARWNPSAKHWEYPARPEVAAALLRAFDGVPVTWDKNAAGLIKAFQDGQAAARAKTVNVSDLPPIPLVKTAPWTHQVAAFWFAHPLPAAMLAMGMRTGKSAVAILLIANRGHRRTLILCPHSVVDVWPEEFAKHCPVPVHVASLVDGSVRARMDTADRAMRAAQAMRVPSITIVNYEAARCEPFASWALAQEWDLVVGDELHRCKAPPGPKGITSKFMRALGRKTAYRLGLTGTPMPHTPLDLFGQYTFLDQTIFGPSWVAVRSRYAVMGGYGNHQVVTLRIQERLADGRPNPYFDPALAAEFQARFTSIAFRVKLREVFEHIPDDVSIERRGSLGPEGRRVYHDLERQFVADVRGGVVTAANAMTRLIRLQQCTSGYARLDPDTPGGDACDVPVDDGKTQLLTDVLEDFAPHEPLVVFSRFHHDLDAIHTVAKKTGRTSLELSGRRKELAAWQAGEADVLAVQEQAGGVGIDLSRSKYGIFYSLTWSLGDFEQAMSRLNSHRQTQPATHIHLIMRGTVDEHMYSARRARRDVVASVLEGYRTGERDGAQ
mgnify:FL=1